MNWFDLLKAVPIDFDKDIQAFGQFGEGPIEIATRQEQGENIIDILMDIVSRTIETKGRRPEIEDLIQEEIKINPWRIYEFLQDKLGKEPTEKQLEDFIVRVIMHEATHAGMKEEQDSMTAAQAEYGAFTGQFPESTYLRIKTLLNHPATEKQLLPDFVAAMLRVNPYRTPETTKKLQEIMGFVDSMTEHIPSGKSQDRAKENLIRLEMMAITQGKDRVRMQPNFGSLNEALSYMANRYGQENIKFIERLYKDEVPEDNEMKLASAKVVTTTSSPAMFNNKVVRGRKKKRDDE